MKLVRKSLDLIKLQEIIPGIVQIPGPYKQVMGVEPSDNPNVPWVLLMQDDKIKEMHALWTAKCPNEKDSPMGSAKMLVLSEGIEWDRPAIAEYHLPIGTLQWNGTKLYFFAGVSAGGMFGLGGLFG